ncbi:MAG: TonB-dependent receptor, partial [bacterium]
SALRSVIALVRDQRDDALRLAESGAGLDPDSPLPQAALSYAHQGRFEIEKALEHAKRAVELAPEDALLWARVSELELSRGDLDAALAAAQKAETLSPALARTQTVLGYAYLTRIEVDQAKSAFERAIQGDPADPLPRLGMGLAKIRDGDLDEGTREIETAASLDPNNSLVRSYLGKAYYEQKRDGLASSEYEQAKLLDPKDPTPWFYDAIHKQTTNRPVEALHDLQRAIELNDNRAVYRSELLLDQDLAARGAALGRIYQELGFEQIALVEGWKSLSSDPTDYTAHRLLSDSYSALPRHGVARTSELLQSQLLQPINITPVQPQLAESDSFFLGGLGPAQPSLNEFNPLFLRNRFSLLASGLLGTHETYGDEVVQSGVWNQFSYSLGQFHYETDGFRRNNDLELDIYNLYAQALVSPNLSIQTELRHRESEHGDLRPRFFGDPIEDRRIASSNGYRVGFRTQLAPSSALLGSLRYDDLSLLNADEDITIDMDPRAYIAELQYLYSNSRYAVVAGGGYYDDETNVSELDNEGNLTSRPTNFDGRHANAYFYSYIRYPSAVTWTVGMSADRFEDDRLGVSNPVNPKLGALWSITPRTTLRLAAFKTLKRKFVAEQTIEPTQVSGFNQLFDDPNGTETISYGLGIDHELTKNITGGFEVSKRDLDVPLAFDSTETERQESAHRAYIDWTPHDQWAAFVQYFSEEFDDKADLLDTNTMIIPLSVTYFSPRGIFASLGLNYLNQEVNSVTAGEDQDEALIVDAALGYRLPRRMGILEIQAQNLTSNEFRYQGTQARGPLQSFRIGSSAPFPQGLTVLVNVTFAF